MGFSNMLNDKISILKQNGETIENQKASVQTNKIFFDNGKVLIESGDLVDPPPIIESIPRVTLG